RVEPLVVGGEYLRPAFDRRVAVTQERGEAAHDVADLAFRVEDDAARVREVRAGAVETEEVREARHRDPQVRARLVAPALAQPLAPAPDDVHRPQESVRVEPGREDDDVDRM